MILKLMLMKKYDFERDFDKKAAFESDFHEQI